MRRPVVSALSVLVAVSGLLVGSAPAIAVNSPQGQLVSQVPAPGTPQVLDGRVLSVVQVGETIVLGGTFTKVRNYGTSAVLVRNGLLAFDATTGKVSTTFDPEPSKAVNVVLPANDGTSVYVGGEFTTIDGVSRSRVARVRVADGSLVGAFNAGAVSAVVKDLRLRDGRLWLAGNFETVGGNAQTAMATVDPTTGAFLPFMGASITGIHNAGVTHVAKFDITPDGSRLVAVGNFAAVNGSTRSQMFMLDLSGGSAALADHYTPFYTPTCAAGAYDTYLRDVDISPDGSFYVISTTGAYQGPTAPCDTTSRFETAATGTALKPSWVDYTGGDTTYAVEITDSVVYVGGHQRWQNNPYASNKPGPGAVERVGIAALDPSNGLPFSWNPSRERGVGVFDFLNTSQGLWVASNTTQIGGLTRARIALMPAEGGTVIAAVTTPTLPGSVYLAGANGSSIRKRSFTGTTAGGSVAAPTGSINWANVRGAFMINGSLFTAWSDGVLYRRSFTGQAYGWRVAVNTSDELTALTKWATDLERSTGMFYDSGRIYFTRSDSSKLYYRYFTPESDVVGAKRFTASSNVAGIDFSKVRGMFTTGTALFWATPNGNLHRATWANGPQAGAPVPGTASAVSGPSIDNKSWLAKALFVYQG